jgi:hypothetical protein
MLYRVSKKKLDTFDIQISRIGVSFFLLTLYIQYSVVCFLAAKVHLINPLHEIAHAKHRSFKTPCYKHSWQLLECSCHVSVSITLLSNHIQTKGLQPKPCLNYSKVKLMDNN